MADRRVDQLDPLSGALAGDDQLLVADASEQDAAERTRRVSVSAVLDARGYRPGPPQNVFVGADAAAAAAARDAYAAANNDAWYARYVANLDSRPRYAVKLEPASGDAVWQELASGIAAGPVTAPVFYLADNTDSRIYRVSITPPAAAWTHEASVATSPRGLAVLGDYLIELDDASDEAEYVRLSDLSSHNYPAAQPFNAWNLSPLNRDPRAAAILGTGAGAELIVYDADGDLYRYNPRVGGANTYVGAWATGVTQGTSIVALAGGDLGLHLSAGSRTIRRYRAGSQVGGGDITIPAGVTTPRMVTASPDVPDRLYVLDADDWAIKALDTSAGYAVVPAEEVAVPAAMRDPTGFAVAAVQFRRAQEAAWREIVGSGPVSTSELHPLSTAPPAAGHQVGDIVNVGGDLYEVRASTDDPSVLRGVSGADPTDTDYVGVRRVDGAADVGSFADPALRAEFEWLPSADSDYLQRVRLERRLFAAAPPAAISARLYASGWWHGFWWSDTFVRDATRDTGAGAGPTATGVYAWRVEGTRGTGSRIPVPAGQHVRVSLFADASWTAPLTVHTRDRWEPYETAEELATGQWLYRGPSQPADPVEGALWVDTSTSGAPALKIWDGDSWDPVGGASGGSGPTGQQMAASLIGTPAAVAVSQAQSRLTGRSVDGAPVTVSTTAVALPAAAAAGDRLVVRWTWHARPGHGTHGLFTVRARDVTGGADLDAIWPIYAADAGEVSWDLPAACASVRFTAVYDPLGSQTSDFTLDLSDVRVYAGARAGVRSYFGSAARRMASDAAAQIGDREASRRAEDLAATTGAIDATVTTLFRRPHLVSLWRRASAQPAAPAPAAGDYRGVNDWSAVPAGWSRSPVVTGPQTLWHWTALATWTGSAWSLRGRVASEDSFDRQYSVSGSSVGAHAPPAQATDRWYRDADPTTGAWGAWLPIYDTEDWTTLIQASTYATSSTTRVTHSFPPVALHELHEVQFACRILSGAASAEKWRASAIVAADFDVAAAGAVSAIWRPGVSVVVDYRDSGQCRVWSAHAALPSVAGAGVAYSRWGFFGQFRAGAGDGAGVASHFDLLFTTVRQVYGTWWLRVR